MWASETRATEVHARVLARGIKEGSSPFSLSLRPILQCSPATSDVRPAGRSNHAQTELDSSFARRPRSRSGRCVPRTPGIAGVDHELARSSQSLRRRAERREEALLQRGPRALLPRPRARSRLHAGEIQGAVALAENAGSSEEDPGNDPGSRPRASQPA